MLRWWGLISVVLGGCRSDETIKVFNGNPEVSIVSHDEAAVILEGEVTLFRAQVSDTNHDAAELEVAWFSGAQILCDWLPPSEDGSSACETALYLDTNLIVEARDPEGAGGVDALQLEVIPTEPPVVEWVEPLTDGTYYSDILIVVNALATDVEDSPELLEASLSSSLEGDVPADFAISSAGELSGGIQLGEGQHVLTLTVEDTMGKIGSDTVNIAVGPPNQAPSCEILEPQDGLVSIINEPIEFYAEVGDVDVSADRLAVTWVSDKDGEIGNSIPSTEGEVVFSTTALSRDVHTITMTVTDELGESCSDLILLSVGDYPSITWSQPTDQSVHAESDMVSFVTVVSDPEDRAEDLNVRWSSDVDGFLGEGAAEGSGEAKLTIDTLSVGAHIITASVTDQDALESTASLSIVIDGAPSAPNVGILPQQALTQDDLTTVVSGSVDPEGLSVSYSYVWQENGINTSYVTGVLPASVTEKDDVWTVIVTPTDGLQQGQSTSASITILNTNPSITTVSISPNQAVVGDSLTCSVTATDVDNEPLSASYAWVNQTTGLALGTGNTLDLDPSIAQPGDIVLCVVTVTDPDGGVSSDSGNMTVFNTEPTLSNVELTPSEPMVWDTVSCGGSISDPDSQGHTLSAEWFVGNIFVGTGVTIDLSTVSISKGDTLRCDLMVTDDVGGTGSGSASAIVVNSPPQQSGIAIVPSPPAMGTVLSCDYSVVDPDGDALVMSYSWTDAIGTELGTSQTLDLAQTNLQPNDDIRCDATAVDLEGEEIGNSVTETIVNTAPSISNIIISPDPHVGALIGCTADISDPDNQALTTTYSWFNETRGQSIGSSAAILLSSSLALRGETISCTLTVIDPYGEMAQETAVALVENALPQLFQLQITPSSPSEIDTLTCSATVLDADGDSIVENIEWTDVNGVSVGSGADLDLVSLGVQTGDVLNCIFSATDSAGGSTSQTISTTVVNAAPVISSVTLSPAQPYTDSDVTVNVVVSDAEGQNVSLSYAWQVDGIIVTETTNQISGVQFFDKNQELSVTVTPSDGIDLGQSVTESVMVANQPPAGLAVRFEPAAPRHHAHDLICELSSPATDIDGDPISYGVSWFVNGQPATVSSQTTYRTGDTIAAADLNGGELWRCEVTPNDGQDDGAAVGVEVEVLPEFVDVAVGASYSCGLDAAGDISCWGSGDALNFPSGSFVEIEAGVYHACAQDISGQLECWGTNHSGSTSAPSTAFADFSMGNSMTCAVKQSDESLECWGNTTDGRSSPPAGAFDIVNGGLSSSCALRSSDGQTECWGENDYGKSTPPTTSFIDVSVGYNTACGLTGLGGIECWGRNHAGQFNVPTETWSGVSVGDTHVCGLTSTGAANCWGDNTLGQSGPPTNEVFSQIQVAVFHSCGLTADGRILCWGDNASGQCDLP